MTASADAPRPQGLPSPAPGAMPARRRLKGAIPYLLMAPGLLWLLLFFVVPNLQMVRLSLSEGTSRTGFVSPPQVWDFGNFPESISRFAENFGNSLLYGSLCTILCFVIGYPLAYTIAFRGGRYKNVLLFLVIAPFFTSFLIRTISWKVILGDQAPPMQVLRAVGLVEQNFSFIGTPLAVVAGLTYNFLPFVVLPLYVSLEKVDRRLIEAAQDLYAGPWRPAGAIVGGAFGALLLLALMIGLGYLRPDASDLFGLAVAGGIGGLIGAFVGAFLISQAFVRVTLPLTLPGIFAASILTFIPALGDYVNATLLGSPRTQMIGNVIQNRYLAQNDYPTASALSFILMAGIIVAILVYARLLGTDELSGGRAI
jgi:spermidine/putrescine transport system permease protein